MARNSKKNYSEFFKGRVLSDREIELNELIDTTAIYMGTHNAVVKRLWEIQYHIAQHRVELVNNPNHLNNHEIKAVKINLKKLENLAQTFLDNLNKNHSAEIINENLEKIAYIYNKLYPKNKINLSSPINLQKLKVNYQ